jgi:hypothetical protein
MFLVSRGSEEQAPFHSYGGGAAFTTMSAEGRLFWGKLGEGALLESVDQGIASMNAGTACGRIRAQPAIPSGEVLSTLAEFRAAGRPVYLEKALEGAAVAPAPSATQTLAFERNAPIPVLFARRVDGWGWRGDECGEAGHTMGRAGRFTFEFNGDNTGMEGLVDMDIQVPSTQGPLDPRVVAYSLSNQSVGAERCVQEALLRAPETDHRGVYSAELTARQDGALIGLTQESSSLADELLEACLESWLQTVLLPPPGGWASLALALEIREATPAPQPTAI